MCNAQEQARNKEIVSEGLSDNDTWYQDASPQWTEILSPYPDFGSFTNQFVDHNMNYTEFTTLAHPSQQSDILSTCSSLASSQASPQSQACQCENDGGTACYGLLQTSLDGQRVVPAPKPTALSPIRSSEVATEPPFVHDRVAILPADRPPERPKRKTKGRQICELDDCGKVFACPYDLNRHLRDVHALGYWIYKCDEPACGYVRPRKDKVKEHCTKKKHPDPVAVYVGDGQNADELATMIEQRRKKGRRRSTCRKCGKHDGDES